MVLRQFHGNNVYIIDYAELKAKLGDRTAFLAAWNAALAEFVSCILTTSQELWAIVWAEVSAHGELDLDDESENNALRLFVRLRLKSMMETPGQMKKSKSCPG